MRAVVQPPACIVSVVEAPRAVGREPETPGVSRDPAFDEAAASATANLRNRLVGTKIDEWCVFVVTVTGRARRSSDPLSVSP